jgi:hypothetical protein
MSGTKDREIAFDDRPSAGVDAAWESLDKHRDARGDATSVKALRRKIDWHIVPVMFCCYTMQFLDKVILNVCIFSSHQIHIRGS